MARGFAESDLMVCTGWRIPRPRVRPEGGCRARSAHTHSALLVGAGTARVANCHRELRLPGPEPRRHPLGPSPAASAAPEKPTHSSSAIFSPILRTSKTTEFQTTGVAGPTSLPASARGASGPAGEGAGPRRNLGDPLSRRLSGPGWEGSAWADTAGTFSAEVRSGRPDCYHPGLNVSIAGRGWFLVNCEVTVTHSES